MGQMNARRYVLDILVDISQNQAFSNISINKHLKGKNIEAQDRKFITELVYGVIENKIYLDFIISKLSKLKLEKINIDILNIIRMGLYQIIFLDRVPAFAAVNESVNLAKKINYKSSGFVNGILRSYLRNMDSIKLPSIEESPVQYLSILYSHPEWMVSRWLNEFGINDTQELLKANNETPKLTIRTNTLKINKQDLIKELQEENIRISEANYISEAIHVESLGNIEGLSSFKKGYFQIQDESSMLVALILDPKPGEYVIDVCSAPGGKTTHMAQLMNNKGYILARDIYEHKLKLIQENARRLGIDIIETQLFNAKEIDQDLLEKADKVLVDAPCSGLGIIRRKPELKYNKKPDDIDAIAKLQLEILANASKYVKKGGYLVYSTCTIEDIENTGVVESFVNHNKDFEIVDVNDLLPKALKANTKYLKLYPHLHKTDGFFISKLRKKL